MRAWHAAILSSVVAAAVFWPTLAFQNATTDDAVYASARERGGVVWALTNVDAGYWIPVAWLTFLADSTHRTNWALHAANAGLLALVLCEFGAAPPAAAAVAVLFSVHPGRVESAAWLAERKGLLAAFFLLLAVLSYARGKGRQRPSRTTLLFAALAMASKPTALVAPALLLCLDFWPLRRLSGKNLRARVVEKWPLWLMSAGDAASTALAESAHRARFSFIPWSAKVPIALLTVGLDLKKTFFPPWRASVFNFMGADPAVPIPLVAVGLSLLALAALSAAAYRRRRQAPWLAAGWAWFLIALIPGLGLARTTAMAFGDRFTYPAHIGLALAIAGFLARKPRTAVAICALALSWLIPVTRNNLAPWRDADALIRREIELDPGNAWAQNQLGTQLTQRGDAAGGLAYLDRAVALRPDYLAALNNRAVALAKLGRPEEAAADLDAAAKISGAPEIRLNRRNLRGKGAAADYLLLDATRFGS